VVREERNGKHSMKKKSWVHVLAQEFKQKEYTNVWYGMNKTVVGVTSCRFGI
jgi:hypothetical protein